MTPDPHPNPDHTCTQCHEPLPPKAVEHADAFCSAVCCRAWHGNPLPTYNSGMHYGSPNWRKQEPV